MGDFIIILLFILGAAAISKRIQGTMITLPIVYVILGLILSDLGIGAVNLSLDNELVKIIAELTLVLVLSTDASRISFGLVRRDHNLPIRLLAVGLPLTMILGALVASLVFDSLILGEVAIVGILLAPTDASLGQAVMTNPLVPQRIRQTLNIESGLNDGIAMPFLLMAVAVVSAEEFGGVTYWLTLGARQIGFGILVGLVMGFLGWYFLLWGIKSRWMSDGFQKISAIVLILLAYGLALLVGGNGFIAAFVFGAVLGNLAGKSEIKELNDYIEVEIELLILLTFMVVFGGVMLPPAIRTLDWQIVLYALLSLTVVRIIPVWISLIRARVRPVTAGFLGWFGPRGTASILYLFTVLEVDDLVGMQTIYNATVITVFLSVILHGLSAAPAARWYGQFVSKQDQSGEDVPELAVVPALPLRGQSADKQKKANGN
ncbi:MAG: cation:proton antiporter [Candidatus Promineifilaceae bacterium]|nr:cation:proton antiporter [Candidatus Promineifilaceae bacterium]